MMTNSFDNLINTILIFVRNDANKLFVKQYRAKTLLTEKLVSFKCSLGTILHPTAHDLIIVEMQACKVSWNDDYYWNKRHMWFRLG